MALQDLDTDDIEGCEFSKKFRAETSGDMEKLMTCVGHLKNSPHSCPPTNHGCANRGWGFAFHF